MTVIHCTFCKSPIARPEWAYQKVQGWARKRGQGGTNSVRLKEDVREWACTFCIDKEAKKINALQKDLFS